MTVLSSGEMTLSGVKSILESKPFRPLTLHLIDGRKMRVTDKFNIGFLSRGDTIAVARSDGKSFALVDVAQICSIELRAASSKKRPKAS